jgi:hypothetical protein
MAEGAGVLSMPSSREVTVTRDPLTLAMTPSLDPHLNPESLNPES